MADKYISKYNIFNISPQPQWGPPMDSELHLAHPHLAQDSTVDVTKWEGIYENTHFVIYHLNSPTDGEVFYCSECSPNFTCAHTNRNVIKPLPVDSTCAHLKFIRSDPELVF